MLLLQCLKIRLHNRKMDILDGLYRLQLDDDRTCDNEIKFMSSNFKSVVSYNDLSLPTDIGFYFCNSMIKAFS
jgi:hypothetical protein